MLVQENGIKAEVNHFLYPGMLVVPDGPSHVMTILGSCISVCLWDSRLKIGGMNHYLLPFWNGEGLKTPKYGNVAVPSLIEKMLQLGSKKANIGAKVFGGANVIESGGVLNIGERNILFAESALEEARIPVLCKDVGGQVGRKVLFRTDSGEVFIKKINKAAQ